MNPRIYNPVFLGQAQHLHNEINKLTCVVMDSNLWFIKIWQSQNTNHLPFFRLADGMNSLSSFFLVTRKSEIVLSENPLLCKNQFDGIALAFKKDCWYNHFHKINWDWSFRDTWKISERILRVTSSLMNPGIEVGLLSIPFDPMFLAACFLFLVASPSDRWNSSIKKSYSASDIWMRSSELHETYTWFYRFERHFIHRSP